MEKKNFNEVLKQRELEERSRQDEDEMALDSLKRVKVLSPGRLVFNRFIRNKLAIIGSAILIAMFVFSFLLPVFYPYSQTQIFYKYDKVMVDYAIASERTEYTALMIDEEAEIHSSVRNKLNAAIKQMQSDGEEESILIDSEGNSYIISREEDNIYGLHVGERTKVCSYGAYSDFASYNSTLKDLKYTGSNTADEGFASEVQKAVDAGNEEFTYGGDTFRLTPGRKGTYSVERRAGGAEYTGASLGNGFEAILAEISEDENFTYNNKEYTVVSDDNGGITVYEEGEHRQIAYLTTYVFDVYGKAVVITDHFKTEALTAACGSMQFTYDGTAYILAVENDEMMIYSEADKEVPMAVLSNIAIRSYSGEDNLEFAYKEKVMEVIDSIEESRTTSSSFEWEIPQLNSEGKYAFDENGDYVKELTQMRVTKKSGSYVISCEQVSYLIDIYAKSSREHLVGTDGDGMDVLARMMYGGRISLMVCFIVIIIETIIGVILGGIAGFFGGWVDNLIMRAVDIFNCIPSLPILIIIGSLFDAQKMEPYTRLIWLMVILGVLGWPSVARMVRGQILSLREQEFMVAAEAIGLSNSRRIFKHLVPNVMPQLIVMASAGLGGIIITESTLSFLGLGVKYPLATWGSIINSVTASSETMIKYTYIWVPVGMLICLTVVAFNFVGDGLRDAFDPKMKR